MPLRNKIDQFARARGISIYRLAKDAGIGMNTAYRLRNNPDQPPDTQTLAKLCAAYKVQPDCFIAYDPD